MRTPLADLLGAAWTLDAPVNALAWSGGHVGFALSDGTLAIARAGWPGAAGLRPRPQGGVEVLAADGPPPPLARASVSRGPCLALAGAAEGFLSGGADGRLRRVDTTGQATRIHAFAPAPVTAAVVMGAGWACLADGVAHTDGGRLDGAGVEALAWHKAVGLAVAHAGGVTLHGAGGARTIATEPARRLAFAPDGGHLAAGRFVWVAARSATLDLPGADAEPLGMAFSADGRLLAHASDAGVRCWDLHRPSDPPTVVTRSAARAVAFHPRRALLAIAHASGAVTLGPPEPVEALPVHPPGAAPIHGLAFDATGAWLATGGVACGLVNLPDLLFRAPVVGEQAA